jgi:hypothetical protein
MESLDFTPAPQERPKTPAELAEILRRQGEEFRQNQEAAQDLDFTAKQAAAEDAEKAADVLKKINGISDDRVVPDNEDPFSSAVSRSGDQANRRGIH